MRKLQLAGTPQLLREFREIGLGHLSRIPEQIEHVFVILSNNEFASTTLKSDGDENEAAFE